VAGPDGLRYHRRVSYRFDDFALDTGTRRLMRGATEIHLSPKAFDLLRILVVNCARVAPKAELIDALWPDTHVLETNLASLVAEIRQALGDSADHPRYIRTVHRIGYWFIGDVEAEDGAVADERPPVRCWVVFDGYRTALARGENVLGRAQNAEVWIDAAGVSRRHACIRIDHDRATIEDLGSKNGTFLGGRPVQTPTSLNDGDQIRLGSVVVTFRIPETPHTTTTLGVTPGG
jgi:DNA-binding winged helix-turn-helix (wHTH) protein